MKTTFKVCSQPRVGAALIATTLGAASALAGCSGGSSGSSSASPLGGTIATTGGDSDEALSPALAAVAQVGQSLFFDASLSEPPGESCASCHAPSHGFADPRTAMPVSPGATSGLFGFRNAPTAAYARFSPLLNYTEKDGWSGGVFLDGRARSLEDQAKGPLLNALEMGNTSPGAVVAKVRRAPYADAFRAAFGANALDDVPTAFQYLAQAIAAFERTPVFAPFTSKFDAVLKGRATLTPEERHGLEVFVDPNKGNCATCHPTTSDDEDGSRPPLLTDFGYDNLGVPRNEASPYLGLPRTMNPDGTAFVDRGLGATLDNHRWDGYFKAPTLRNVAVTAPYMHNGVFTTLDQVVDFYNTRDTKPWPATEFPDTVNHEDLGNLHLTQGECDDLVAFMLTLTDGFVPRYAGPP